MDNNNSQILIYQTEDGQTKIDVRLQDETVWLTQRMLAELFQTTPQNITLHLKNIYQEGELQEDRTCKDFLQVQREGTRTVQRQVNYYNLDAIISVGYRIQSHVATRFRQWATQHIREYIVKGFVLDDERLKIRTSRSTISTNCYAAFRIFAPQKSGFIRKLSKYMRRVRTMTPQRI